MTGGVEAALTKKETFLEGPNEDWTGLPPKICLAASTEALREEDEIKACAAISSLYPVYSWFVLKRVNFLI